MRKRSVPPLVERHRTSSLAFAGLFLFQGLDVIHVNALDKLPDDYIEGCLSITDSVYGAILTHRVLPAIVYVDADDDWFYLRDGMTVSITNH